jgi:hypothetical protein
MGTLAGRNARLMGIACSLWILRGGMGHDEEEPKLFTLTEAERTRRQLEPVLIEAVETRRKLLPLEEELGTLSARIQTMGGIVVPYEKVARVRFDHDRLAESLNASVQKIQATGCVLKDLDAGLLDFPAILNNEEVYLCWRLGEERIRFYHRQDEGFAGRKPIEPGDTGPDNPIQ